MTDNGDKHIEGEDEASSLSVRSATANDAQAICQLFNKIFGEEMLPAHWRWKYQRELSRAIVVYKGEDLIAHYGGVGTNILLEGKQSTAIQITDLMVDHGARNAVRSNSPFYLCAIKFLENFVGFNKPFLLGYGFPSERAMGLSEKLGLFAPVGRMWESQWPATNIETGFSEKIIALDISNYQRYEKKITLLWKKFSQHFSNHIVICKDADYFRWRYLEHPSKEYSLYLVLGRFTQRPKALLVMKHDKNKSMLMDILTLSIDMSKVIESARNISSQKNTGTLVTWHSENYCNDFSVQDARQSALPIVIPANTGSKGPLPETQYNKWWFMPGDTDYL